MDLESRTRDRTAFLLDFVHNSLGAIYLCGREKKERNFKNKYFLVEKIALKVNSCPYNEFKLTNFKIIRWLLSGQVLY